jgi:hypothetical protein
MAIHSNLSDARTKSNIRDADVKYYYNLVKSIRVRNFEYNDGNTMNIGVIAQEMETNNDLRFMIGENGGYTFNFNDNFPFQEY